MSSATVNALLACCAISMREPAPPKHKLHRARPAHLVQRVQNTQRVAKCRYRLSKLRVCTPLNPGLAGATIDDGSEIGMVKHIERLRPELQAEPLVNGEFSPNSQI